MSILLYLALLFLCLRWLHRSQKSPGQMISISFSFMGGSLFSFALSILLENEYLDGVKHLLILSFASLFFWITALFFIWRANPKLSKDNRILDSLIISLVPLLPILIYGLLASASLKIGG
ncbi:hypothetical protein [Croceimicrobium hydrocarbonivorans]|uniref:Uncharacterized protein n=1 Tax=Croceimicrobium hydrocarbonivorans TaxID=2761580 RepID=A0A7H0VCN6_9FLAO|nr:hypothetical protein [Croceimicrobium hydrocarbonivorans]QNR23484.1 hypothetical protein H4K34_14015 [Croceimicrobium hydrocarbonivorans]